ncbi:hypothetical protein AB0K34_13780 [Actinomadura sp. NPDC049382]|uniref:hypothetical protein n=1 Tax=Actinomadura sp. NPDC049382 TaxID=3158220 RepID=UPI003429B0C0
MNGWSKSNPLTTRVLPGVWCARAAAVAAELLDRPLDDVVEEFGETVLIRQTLNGFEFRRMPPAPDSPETRAKVTEIIAKARRKQAEAVLGRMRRGELSKAGALSALRSLGYNRAHATELTRAARQHASINVSPAQTQPASLADILNAVDWQRINAGFRYALLHGGNLPPGFMNELRRGRS